MVGKDVGYAFDLFEFVEKNFSFSGKLVLVLLERMFLAAVFFFLF